MSFSEWITEELKTRGISQRQLSKLSGIAQGHLSNVLTGKRPLTADLVIQVADALDVSAVTALTIAGLLPPEPEETSKEDLAFFELNEVAKRLTPARLGVTICDKIADTAPRNSTPARLGVTRQSIYDNVVDTIAPRPAWG